MNGINDLSLFLATSAIIIIAPGPDFIYVVTRGVSEGSRAGIMSALGISTGLLIHTLFAALGLSVIIQTSQIAFLIVKFAGAAYLIYLGVKAIMSKTVPESFMNKDMIKHGNIFKQGVLTNVFNPKAIITFMAFLPQFIDLKVSNHALQFCILGTLFAVIAVLWFIAVGHFAGVIGAVVKRNKMFQQGIKYISGTVMIWLGFRLATQKN